MTEYDIIILGGGPAGAVAGMQLAKEGLRVLILEADNFEGPRVGETLPPNFRETIVSIGLEAEFKAQQHKAAYAFGSAWGTDQATYSSHMEDPYGQGWHINRAKFDKMLFEQACQKGSIGIQNCRILSVESLPNQEWQVEWIDSSGKQRAQGRFLLNACGRKNVFHKRMKDESIVYDELAAVALIIQAYTFKPETALIESVEAGWWYSSPLPNGNAIVMLITDLDLITSMRLTDLNHWLKEVKKAPHTGKRLDQYDDAGTLFVRPAFSHRISQVRAVNYLPIGDALVSFDPLNGAGIIRAIQTATGAARVVQRHFSGDQEAVPEFIAAVGELYEDYLDNRKTFYALEKRWPNAPFWARRLETNEMQHAVSL